MRIKLTIILLFLNVAAFCYIYYLERQSDLRDVHAAASRSVLPHVDNIDRIEIELTTEDGEERRSLIRQRGHWQMTRPYYWPANENAVQRIITQLQFLEKEISFSLEDLRRSGQTLADYGLDEPTITLRYFSGERETVLKVGSPTQMGRRLYLLHPDANEILVVGQALMQSLILDTDDLRRQRFFDIPSFEINALTFQEGERRVRMAREGAEWKIEAPIQTLADNELTEDLMNLLTSLRAIRLFKADPQNLNVYGLDNPEMRLTLAGPNQRQTLLIGGEVQTESEEGPAQRYAMLEDNRSTFFTVGSEPFGFLTQAQEVFRNRQFLRFELDAITTMEITQDENSLTLQKLDNEQGEWQLLARSDGQPIHQQAADSGQVKELLETLHALEALSFVNDAPSDSDELQYGLKEPNATIRLSDGRNHPTLILGGINPETNLLYAKMADSKYVYGISPRILSRASTNPLQFQSRILEQLPQAARIRSLTIRSLTQDTVLFEAAIDIERTTWPVFLEEQYPEQKESILELIDSVKRFQVRNFVYPRFEAPEGIPWAYRMDVEIVLPGGERAVEESRTFYLTQRVGGNLQFGGSEEKAMTFSLTQPFIDAFFPLSFEKEPPELPATPEALEQASPPETVGGVE